MKDYTYNGVPVAEMNAADIHNCLANGVKINYTTAPGTDHVGNVIERLRIELLIRETRMRERL